MIRITDKSLCCGCGSCAQRCPQHCITMESDEQGFLYPRVDDKQCVDCGLCERVCPIINHREARQPLAVYAAINPDEEIRLKSSSGGIFSMLAEQTINQGGVVFGAKFDANWNVIHDYTETIDGIAAFRGSKYVQSSIGDNYSKAEKFLKQGRAVLFTGTPCQIAGLKHFLGKDYENLLTAEVACHGVPSPLVWKRYLHGKDIAEVNFRDKSTGWKDYSIKIGKKKNRHGYSDYMNCFLANFSLRPSCFNCQAKNGKSVADITIADFWGINQIAPDMDDDRGTSAIVVWSNHRLQINKRLTVRTTIVNYSSLTKYNPAIAKSSLKPTLYNQFWEKFSTTPQKAIKQFATHNCPTLLVRMKSIIYHILHS